MTTTRDIDSHAYSRQSRDAKEIVEAGGVGWCDGNDAADGGSGA